MKKFFATSKRKLVALTLVFLIIGMNVVYADELPQTQVAVMELKYPPIRLEVAEANLTPTDHKAKDELVQASQVFEDALHMNGAVYRDEALEAKVNSLIPVEYLGEKAKGFKYRIFILKDPTLNAMATPTGSIYIHSGLLANLDNFDQLRLVIGHEVHHILDQDIVHRFQKIRSEVGTIKVLQLIAAPAVAIAIGESDSKAGATIANIYTAANYAIGISYYLAVMGYGRENETECDMYAVSLFRDHAYELSDAEHVFELFEKEWERFGGGFRSHYFEGHETGKQRAKRVHDYIQEHGLVAGTPKSDPAYAEFTKALRLENALINIRIKRVQHALDDLDRLEKTFANDPQIAYLRAEAYARLSDDPEMLKKELSRKEWNALKIKDLKKQGVAWAEQAKGMYAESIRKNPQHADAYRGMAILLERLQEDGRAIEKYEEYLKLSPDAKDRRFVEAKVKRLKRLIEKQAEAALKMEAKKS